MPSACRPGEGKPPPLTGRPAVENGPRHADDLDQIFACQPTFLSYRENISPPRVSAGRGCRRDPLGGARDWTLRRYGRSIFSHSQAMVLEYLQSSNRVRERVTEPRLDPARRERVEFFAIRFRKIELALPDPCAGNGEIVGDRHRQLVDRRLVLVAGRQSREVSQQDRGPAEERQSVFDRLVQGHTGVRKTLAMR